MVVALGITPWSENLVVTWWNSLMDSPYEVFGKVGPNPTVNTDVPVRGVVLIDATDGTPVTWFR